MKCLILFSQKDKNYASDLATKLQSAKQDVKIRLKKSQNIDIWRQEFIEDLDKAEIIIICVSPKGLEDDLLRREILVATQKFHSTDIILLMVEKCYFEIRKYEETRPLSNMTTFDGENYSSVISQLLRTIHKNEISLITNDSIQSIQEEARLSTRPRTDWGEAPTVEEFFGRENELEQLSHWVLVDACRVVTILGLGGVGKTLLSVQLAKRVNHDFDYLIWRSLRNAPPCEDILREMISILSDQREANLHKGVDSLIGILVKYLRERKCLLVLDNFEAVLGSGIESGQCKRDLVEYCLLVTRVGEIEHKSCLIISSREKIKGLSNLEAFTRLVRTMQLQGLDEADSKRILSQKQLVGSERAWNKLIDGYSGNPLALKLVSSTIELLFGKDIDKFLQQDTLVFSDIRDVLDSQFERLSDLEKSLMYWLAIEREWVTIDELQNNIFDPCLKTDIVSVLMSLQRHAIIEKNDRPAFTLQPVVMEYVTERFIVSVYSEVAREEVNLFLTHFIMKAQAKDYIRNMQERLILCPIINRLSSAMGKVETENKVKRIVSTLRLQKDRFPGYVAGNALNLLVNLGSDLSGSNFSDLPIWQAYLRNVNLYNVDFTRADLSKAVFTETFGNLLSVTFSKDGQLLAAGTSTNDVRIWNALDGKQLLVLRGHTDWVRDVDFSPDNRFLVSCSEDQTVKIWDVNNGQCLKTFLGHSGRIRSVAFGPKLALIASASEDSTIRFWTVDKDEPLRILTGHTGPIRSVAFNSMGNLLVTGSDDQTVRVWDVKTGDCVLVLRGHLYQVWSVGFDPKGNLVGSGGEDATVKLWDINGGKLLYSFVGHKGPIRSISFDKTGDYLASGSEDHTIRIWSLKTHECKHTLFGHTNRVRSIEINLHNQTLASGSEDQTVRLWDISTGYCIKTLQGYTNRIWSVSFNPKNNLLAYGSDDHTVKIWDTSTSRLVKTLYGHSNQVRSVAFNSDGALLVTSSDDHTVRLWDLSTGNCKQDLMGHSNRVGTVAISPDDQLVASGSDDQTIRIWDISSGQALSILQGHSGWIWSIVFTPNGKYLVSGSEDKTTRIWEVESHSCIKVLQTGRVWSVAVRSDGKVIATGCDDRTVRVWGLDTGECIAVLKGHTGRGVWAVSFNPTGDLLASGGDDQAVKLWDLTTMKCSTTFLGHTRRLRSVGFSADGKLLASAGDDEAIRLWSPKSKKLVGVIKSSRPYEGLLVKDIHGLTEVQKSTLFDLGAIDHSI